MLTLPSANLTILRIVISLDIEPSGVSARFGCNGPNPSVNRTLAGVAWSVIIAPVAAKAGYLCVRPANSVQAAGRWRFAEDGRHAFKSLGHFLAPRLRLRQPERHCAAVIVHRWVVQLLGRMQHQLRRVIHDAGVAAFLHHVHFAGQFLAVDVDSHSLSRLRAAGLTRRSS